MAADDGPDVIGLLHDKTSYGVYGDHGGAQESVQRVPMVFWAPGVDELQDRRVVPHARRDADHPRGDGDQPDRGHGRRRAPAGELTTRTRRLPVQGYVRAGTVVRITQRHLAIRRSRTKPNSSNRLSGPVCR